jgi:HD-like signal output (HDOD) protein
MSQAYIPAFTLTPAKPVAEARPAHNPNTPNFINDIAAGKVELPTIPRVVQQLIAALRDPDVDTRTIAQALAKDPVLSAKVLRLANSSFFGGQRSMASIDSAVAMIGMQALNRLIVACGVRRRSARFRDRAAFLARRPRRRDRRQQARSAPRRGPGGSLRLRPVAATGHLILCQTYPDIADFVLSGYAVVRGAELAAIERDNFGTDHPTVGALWVETIGFPQAVADTIRNEAQPVVATASPLDLALRGACALARAVAQKEPAASAWATLPPTVKALYAGADGQHDAAFDKLYEALQETEPAL